MTQWMNMLGQFALVGLVGGIASAGQVTKLLPTGGHADADFGAAVAIDGTTVVIGSPGDDLLGEGAGAAFVFDAVTRLQIDALRGSGIGPGDGFGSAVAVSGGIVAIGAPLDDERGVDAGAVYLFDASTGGEIVTLRPPVGSDGVQFGRTLDSDGGLLVVGSPFGGTVDVYANSSGLHLGVLTPPDGGSNDRFGDALSIDGGVVAVGAPAHANGPLFLAGAVYLYDANTRVFRHKLLPDDAAVSDFFGAAVCVDGDVVAVGAWAKSIIYDHSGAAYLFDASSGAQTGSRLVPADSADRDNFGFAITSGSDTVWVGAPGDSDIVFECGSVYTFDPDDGSELFETHAFDAAPLDGFGSALAMSDRWVVVGSPQDDDQGASSGAAYLIRHGGCSVDLNGDGSLDVFDVIEFLARFESGSTDADWNDDGLLDIFDITSYLGDFSQGC